MYPSVSAEAIFFLSCIFCGALSVFVYDILRISRRIVKVGTFAVTAQDILFFVAAGLLLFYTAYLKNSGEIRWSGFLGGFSGAAAYIFVFRNRVVDMGTAVVRWLMKLLVRVIRICLFPIRLLLKAMKKPVEVVAWYTGKSVNRAKRAASLAKHKAKIRAKSAVMLIRKK